MFIKNVSIVFLIQIITAFLAISTNLFLAWQLSPEEKGIIFLLVTNPSLAVVVLNFGLPVAGAYIAAQNKYNIKELLSTILFSVICITGLIFFISWAFFPLFVNYFYIDVPVHYINISLSTIPPYLLSFLMSDIFWALKKIRAFIAVKISLPIISFSMILILVGYKHQGVFGALIGYATGYYLSGIITLFLILMETKLSLKFNAKLLQELLGFGSKVYLARSCQQLVHRIDIPLINYFGMFQGIGLYSIAIPLSELVWHIPGAVGYVLLPMIASQENEDMTRLTALAIKHTLIIASFLGILILTVVAVLVQLIPLYYPALLLTAILLFGTVIGTVFQILFNFWFGKGQVFFVFIISLSGFITALILYFLLIPVLSEVGAAIASSLIYILESLLALIIWSRTENILLSKNFLLSRDDILIYRRLIQKLYNLGLTQK